MSELTIILPGLPPALNHQYQTHAQGGKGLTTVAKKWQADATLLVRNARNLAEWTVGLSTPLEVTVTLMSQSVWAWDVDGRLKCLCDAVAAGLEHDDRWIQSLRVRKYKVAGDAFTRVTIRPLTANEIAYVTAYLDITEEAAA